MHRGSQIQDHYRSQTRPRHNTWPSQRAVRNISRIQLSEQHWVCHSLIISIAGDSAKCRMAYKIAPWSESAAETSNLLTTGYKRTGRTSKGNESKDSPGLGGTQISGIGCNPGQDIHSIKRMQSEQVLGVPRWNIPGFFASPHITLVLPHSLCRVPRNAA